MRSIRLLFFCLWFCWAGFAPVQAQALPGLHFDAVGANSIPRGVVAAVAQDKAGFIWVATGDGLVRFDGYSFRPQERASPLLASRNLGWIRALLGARDGRLWIGTEAGGLGCYDPATERVTLWRSDGADPDAADAPGYRPLPTIWSLAEDRDGAIWVGSAGGGLQRFDPATGKFTQQYGLAEGLPDERVQAVLIDAQGTRWAGSWAGLTRLAPTASTLESVPALAGLGVQAMLQADDGRIWLGTQLGGLARLNALDLSVEWLSAEGSTGAQAGRAINTLVDSGGGEVWVGRNGGLERRDAASGQLLQTLRHDARRQDGLAADALTSMVRDRAGQIWIGSLGGGLQRSNPANKAFWIRAGEAGPGDQGGILAEANVPSLLQLREGPIWAAPQSGGVAVLDDHLRVTGALRFGVALPQPLPRISAMAQAEDGSVWLGTELELLQVSVKGQVLRRTPNLHGITNGLLLDPGRGLWVAGRTGLALLANGADKLRAVGPSGELNSLALAKDGALWFGGTPGLFRIKQGSLEARPIRSPPGQGLANPVIGRIFFDSLDRLWLDTAVAGLHRMSTLDGELASFDRVSERHGMVGRPFGVNLQEDERGRIWTQMHVYDPAADRMDRLTPADGFELGTGWFRSYAKTLDGRLLFGGSKGVLVVQPQAYDTYAYLPPLVVSGLRINGERQAVAASPERLQLSPQQRSFSVEFAALDYSDPARLRYAYQLQGFDPDWINAGAEQRAASYSNLAPGHYLLRVRGTNRSDVWSAHELSIPVQVLPAWWQTWWARLLALALVLWGLFAVVQLRTRLLRLRQARLERKVAERTTELQALTLALQQESAALAEASLTDPLTGLRNRRFLSLHVDADVALVQRQHESHVLHGSVLPADADLIFFLIDMDYFKAVNDDYGHAAGDVVLQQMRARLQSVFRETDYLVHWGGEEFLVLARASSRCHAGLQAERLRAAVADRPFVLDDGRLLNKTCSIGLCTYPLAPQCARALTWADAVKLADDALFVVKTAGRNGWLGLVSAQAESADALRAAATQPLAEWAASGALELVGSGLQGGQPLRRADVNPAPVQ